MYVIYWTHTGMELIGVNNPLMSWNTIMNANITKILCSIVDEELAIEIPIPDITRLNRMAARYIAPMHQVASAWGYACPHTF